jgi:type IV fimbrial biogenesis protein FimT
MSRTRNAGFTLLELMVTIAILAVLIALGMPSFQDSLRSNRAVTTTNELLASLSLARTEAIRGLGAAGVCASADGANCQTSTDWSGGWMVWREERVGAVLVRTTVRYVQSKSQMTVTGPNDGIIFTTQGRSQTGATQFNLSPTGVTGFSKCVLVNVTGQTRSTKAACP